VAAVKGAFRSGWAGSPGRAGKVANWITVVCLSYVHEGPAPRWPGPGSGSRKSTSMTAVISLVMGLLLDPGVPDQGQLAIDLCTDTSADGIRFDFVCGDEVYGNCTEFRDFLEARGRGTYCGCGRTSTWRGPPRPP